MKIFYIISLIFLTKISFCQIVGMPYVINGLDTVRILVHDIGTDGYHPGGWSNQLLSEKYIETDNFGIDGTFKCLNLEAENYSNLTSGDITLDLLRNFDLYIVVFVYENYWQNSELAIIKDWVDNFGGSIIVVEDSHAYDRIGSYFNLSHGGYYNLNNFSPIAEIEEPQHPIFNNVFGSVDSIFSEYWVGHYEHPLPSDVTSLATDSSLTTANSVIVSYNNGKAIFLTDHGFCSSTFMNNGGNISTQTEIFWANLLSWALQK